MDVDGLAFGAIVLVIFLFVVMIITNKRGDVTMAQLKRAAVRAAKHLSGRVVSEQDGAITVEFSVEGIEAVQFVLCADHLGCSYALNGALSDVSAAWSSMDRSLEGVGKELSYQERSLELNVERWRALLGLGVAQPSSAFEMIKQEYLSWSFSLRDGQLKLRCQLSRHNLEYYSLEDLVAKMNELFLGFVKELRAIASDVGVDALLTRLILSGGGDEQLRRWAVSASADRGWSQEHTLGLFEQLVARPADLLFAFDFMGDELLETFELAQRLALLERVLQHELQHEVTPLVARSLESCQSLVTVEQLEAAQIIEYPRASFKLMRARLDVEGELASEVVQARVYEVIGRLDVAGVAELLSLMASYPQWSWGEVLPALTVDQLRSTLVVEALLDYCERCFMHGVGLPGTSSLAQVLVWAMACARQGQLERLVPLLFNVCGELALAPLVEAQRHSDEMEVAGRTASRRALERLVSTLKLDASKVGALSVAADDASRGGLSVAGERGALRQTE